MTSLQKLAKESINELLQADIEALKKLMPYAEEWQIIRSLDSELEDLLNEKMMQPEN